MGNSSYDDIHEDRTTRVLTLHGTIVAKADHGHIAKTVRNLAVRDTHIEIPLEVLQAVGLEAELWSTKEKAG